MDVPGFANVDEGFGRIVDRIDTDFFGGWTCSGGGGLGDYTVVI